MRFLIDQNLAPRLVQDLSDLYPDSIHVRDLGMTSAKDEVVWNYAAANGLMIVSKDSGFYQRSLVYGHPPKIAWIKLGNCPTAAIAALLRSCFAEVKNFAEDSHASFLVLG